MLASYKQNRRGPVVRPAPTVKGLPTVGGTRKGPLPLKVYQWLASLAPSRVHTPFKDSSLERLLDRNPGLVRGPFDVEEPVLGVGDVDHYGPRLGQLVEP